MAREGLSRVDIGGAGGRGGVGQALVSPPAGPGSPRAAHTLCPLCPPSLLLPGAFWMGFALLQVRPSLYPALNRGGALTACWAPVLPLPTRCRLPARHCCWACQGMLLPSRVVGHRHQIIHSQSPDICIARSWWLPSCSLWGTTPTRQASQLYCLARQLYCLACPAAWLLLRIPAAAWRASTVQPQPLLPVFAPVLNNCLLHALQQPAHSLTPPPFLTSTSHPTDLPLAVGHPDLQYVC